MLAGGNKKCRTIDEEDDASPSTALVSVLLTFTIDEKEDRGVEIIDITNAHIQKIFGDKEDKVILIMVGQQANIMMMTPPKIYCKYINIKKKRKKCALS